MRWSDRMKLTFETFKRVALPLYLWFFIFAFAGVGLMIAGLIPFLIPLIHSKGNFSGPFINPNPPMPPGRSFSSGLFPFSHNLAPYLDQVPYLLLIFAIILLLAWIATSAFVTGIFNLTRKGFYEKASFRDFRFLGIPRVLGWYGILTLVSVLLMAGGLSGALALRRMTYVLPLFAGLYVLALIALGIFFTPWLLTSAYYMLNHRELSFGRSLSGSWDFYRRNLGSLWLLFVTLIGVQILISIINQASQSLGFLVILIASPFTALLPIVWVLSLEEEKNQKRTDSTSSPISPAPSISPSTPFAPSSAEYSVPQSPVNSPLDEALPPQPSEPNSPIPKPSSEPSIDSPEPQEHPLGAKPENSPAEPLNYCPTCGQKTQPGANYCTQCGSKL